MKLQLAICIFLFTVQNYTYPDCNIVIPSGMPMSITATKQEPVYTFRREVSEDVLSVTTVSVKANTQTGEVRINTFTTDRPKERSTEAWAKSLRYDRYAVIITEVETKAGRWVIDTDDLPSIIAKAAAGQTVEVKARFEPR